MTPFFSFTRVALSTVGAVIVGACAAPGGPGIEAQSTETAEVAPIAGTEATVLGKLDLVVAGKKAKLGKMTAFTMHGTAALVLPEGADTALALQFDKEGWFAWKLKPGSYFLLSLKSVSHNSNQVIPVDARFEVASDDKTIYIGHISVEISGSRSSVSFQDMEADARDEMRNKYGDAESPAKHLLRRADRIGTYAGVRSVCDKAWGLLCSRELKGVAPVHPELWRGLGGTTFSRIENFSPTLKWQPAGTPGVSYDVAVWEAASYRLPQDLMITSYIPGHLAHYEENVVGTELVLAKPLKPKTKYFWSVRGRYGDVVSSWSSAGHYTNLIVSRSWSSGSMFAFETP